MISYTGENLSVLICCSHLLHHDWMTFLSWYSFQQNLPDAKISILCNRKDMKFNLFNWTKRLGVTFEITKNDNPISCLNYALKKSYVKYPVLVISPDIICLQELDDEESIINSKQNYKKENCYILYNEVDDIVKNENLFANVKENKFSRFVSYSSGWGNFNADSWINKLGNPLSVYSKHDNVMLTINERRFSNIWKDACNVFHSVC